MPANSPLKEQVEKHLSDIIAHYIHQNECVSVQKVVENLFSIYKVAKWSDLKIVGVEKPYRDLTTLSNLAYKHSTVNLYADAFQHIRIIGTLSELEQEISHQLKKDSYHQLNIGPILKHPRIIQLFKLDKLNEMQKIRPTSTLEIIELFYNYTSHFKYGERIDFDAFREHAAKSLRVDTWTQLGVHEKGFPYILQTCRAMKKAVRTQNTAWSEKIKEIEIELCQKELENMKRKFENALSDDNRQVYMTKTPVDVFYHLLEVVDEKMDSENDLYQMELLSLLEELKNSELHRYLMNMAIYLGTIQEPKRPTLEIASDQTNKQASSSSTLTLPVNNDNVQKPKVPLHELCRTLYKFIKESDGLFQMSTLIEIQRKLCQLYKIDEKNDFTSLGYGDFIKFLHDHKRTIDQHLEFYLFNADSCGGIKRTELFTFVSYLLNNNIHNEKIEKAVKYHFNLQNLKQIGYHNIAQLCERVQKQKQNQNAIKTIQYEEALLGAACLDRLDVNIHGPIISDDDHLCEYLMNCPLLVDIISWSHWNRLYLQDKGHIKDFLHRNKSKLPNMLWLEVSYHEMRLIRLSDTSNIEKFENDLMQMHLKEAAAHLISLAIQEKDCTRLPIRLLRTIMEGWFENLKQSDMLHGSPHYAIEILNLLNFLPFPFSSALVQQLILESAEHIFPDCKSDVWILAKRNLVQKIHLEEIGLTLGIEEWTRDLRNEVAYPSDAPLDTTLEKSVINTESCQEQNMINEDKPVSRLIDGNNVFKKQNSIVRSHSVRNDDRDITPFQHIQEIREALGKTTDLNDESQPVVGNLQDLLGECLKKLADDLFSDQGHFVLELIQNADDNDYSKLNENSTPKLKFIINNKQIIIYNNENGFQKQHINSICAVGKSTKGQHKEGYCGHKGIGFKSVFVVSNKPEIHSNNYHICFDASAGDHVGYICPIWLNEYEPIVDQDDNHAWTTCIRLNLKTDEGIQKQIKQKFDNINPKLLLFLNRLMSLEIDFNGHIKTFTRREHSKNIIELIEIDGNVIQKNYWLVIKKRLSIPETLQKKLREIKSDVVSTSVAIGFPLQFMEQCLRSNTPLPPQHLFAFLPVRLFGFRFVLQADFEVPASRQDIRTGNEWNEWLRDEMAQLLPDAYDHFTDLSRIFKDISSSSSYYQTIDAIEALKYFLKFIPVTNEVDPYFQGFIERCLVELNKKIKFPVRTDNPQHEVEWQPPSKCIIVRDSFIRKILSSNLLLKYCGKYLLHESLHNVDEKVLSLFDIDKLNISHIIKIIKKHFFNQKESPTSSIEQIAQWLICLNYSLEQMKYLSHTDEDDGDDTLQLKELKMVPIENHNELVSTSDMVIFFPDKVETNSIEMDQQLLRMLNNLPTIKIELFQYVEQHYFNRLEEIKELLKKFGVVEKRFDKIYSSLIKPAFENEIIWKTKGSETLMLYLLYVYKHVHHQVYSCESDFDMDDFKNIVRIKCQNNEFYNPVQTTIHLSTTNVFNDTINQLFKDNKCMFMSDDYSNYLESHDKKQWHMFLETLGISELFRIEAVSRNQLRGTQWENYEEEIRKDYPNATEYRIEDFTCNEFKELFDNNENHYAKHSALYHEISLQFLSYLNKTPNAIRRYCRTNIFSANNPYSLKEVDTTFYACLKQCNWIPTKCIEYIYDQETKEIRKNETIKLNQPMNVLIRNDNDRANMLSHYFPFIDNIKLNQELISQLNIISRIEPQDIALRLLAYINDSKYTALSNIDLSQINEDHEKEKLNALLDNPPHPKYRRKFIESISTMNILYNSLYTEFNTDKRYMKWPLVFVPDSPISDKNSLCIGHFLFMNEVAWSDPTHLLTDHNMIGSLYPDLESIFKHVLKIPSVPKAELYIELLRKYSNEKVTDRVTENVWKIIEELNGEDSDDIIKLFRRQPLVPSMTQCGWIKFDDELYIPDDKIIAELFKLERLPIIKLPENGLTTNQRKFLDRFQCKNFSDVLVSSVIVTNAERSDDLKKFYALTLPFISNYLYNEADMFDESYNRRDLSKIFLQMKFFSVASIHVTYELKYISVNHDCHCYLDRKSKRFYLLNTQHYSQSIDTMIRFIIDDSVKESGNKQNKLDKYYKKLLAAYSKDQLNQNITQDNDLPKPVWIINVDNNEENDNEIDAKENVNDYDNEDKKIASDSLLAKEICNEEKILTPKSKLNNKTGHREASTEANKSTKDAQSTNNTRQEHHRIDTTSNFVPQQEDIRIFKRIDLTNLKGLDKEDFVEDLNEVDEESLRKIGHFGEKWTHIYLTNLYKDNQNVLIKWLNENGETGLPYDIEINFIDSSQNTQRIEVKTTSKHVDNYQFPISIQEVKEIIKNPNTYYIYRVNLSNHTLTIIENIKQNLSVQRQLQLKMNVLTPSDLNEKK